MNNLDIINAKLQKLNDELVSYANTLEFEPICEFDLENCDTQIPWSDLMFSGVYLIEIKNDLKHSDFTSWVTGFQKEWEDLKYKPHFVPNLRK